MVDIEAIKERLRALYGLAWFTDERVDKLARYFAVAGVSQPLEVIATHTADMLASQYDEIGA